MSASRLQLLLPAIVLVTFAISAVATLLVRRVALRIGFIDHPGGHKSHRAPIAYGGGIAIFVGAWLPLALVNVAVSLVDADWISRAFGDSARHYLGGMREQLGSAWVVWGGGTVLHFLGLLDDRKPLGAPLKLSVMLAVAILVPWFGGVRIGEWASPPIAIAITACWFIIIINAMNFLDNMDGLSAGVATICLAFFSICGLLADQLFVPAFACLCVGAVAGFLLFNFPPARIFMGDAGSLLVGYMLAVISTLTTYFRSGEGGTQYALAMPLVVLAIPLYDCTTVVAIRLREGRNPMRGDQRHFSHRLVDHGLSRAQAVLTIYLATATTGLAATLLPGIDLRGTLTVGAIVVLVLTIVGILETPPRKPPVS